MTHPRVSPGICATIFREKHKIQQSYCNVVYYASLDKYQYLHPHKTKEAADRQIEDDRTAAYRINIIPKESA